MNLKRTLAIAATVAALGSGSLLVANSVSADEAGNTMVDRLVEIFNLDRDEVQVVFDEFHSEKQAEREAKMEERLNKAVENGKLTEEQKTLIMQKHAENKSFFESLKDMSQDERKDAMEQHRKEMKAWAEENGIDMPFGKMGPGGKGGPGGKHGPRPF